MDSAEVDLASIQFSMKLLTEFNLEAHFAFSDGVKTFDRVKRHKLFEI